VTERLNADGIKVNAYELGWRFTGDNLRTQVAATTRSGQTITINKTDMTINIEDDEASYLWWKARWITSLPTATGAPVRTLTPSIETRVDGKWEKLTVDSASPSKMSAWVTGRRATGPCACKARRPLISLTDGKKIDGYNTVDLLGSYSAPG
jgi:iron complex outermembrane receptor protein